MARQAKRDILVDPAWLAAGLDDPAVRVIDCTLRRIARPSGASSWESGRVDWQRAHIPGAAYVDMSKDLSDPAARLPLTMPDPRAVWRVLSRLGIPSDARIVVYGEGAHSAVHRVWWVLMAAGARDVRVLDGGLRRWSDEGLPVASGEEMFVPTEFEGVPRLHWFASKSDVIDCLGRDAACLVHSLTREQFLGTGGQVYGRPGHIPGSVNVPAAEVFDLERGLFRDQQTLESVFDAAGIAGHDPIITYCGGGIAASTTFLALTLLGYDNVRLYDGSLLEWANDSDLPMKAG